MISCRDFQANFDAFIAGDLDGRLLRDCEQHMTSCVHCLDLWAEHAVEQDITAEALASRAVDLVQITGSDACVACEDMLCDYVDGSLDESSLALVSLHLETCEFCQLTANALDSLRTDLPGLCDVEASPELLGSILSQTQPAYRRPGITGRFTVFSRLILRPRFPIEVSYVGTLIWVLFFGFPSPPGDESPAYSAVQSLPAAIAEGMTGIQQHITNGVSNIDRMSQGIVQSGLRNTSSLSRQAFQGANKRFRQIVDKEITIDNARNQYE